MTTIPDLVRATGLPDADKMADWLELKHSGLEKRFVVPSYAIGCAFKWRETPFGNEGWLEVYVALRIAEITEEQDLYPWDEIPKHFVAGATDENGETYFYGRLNGMPVERADLDLLESVWSCGFGGFVKSDTIQFERVVVPTPQVDWCESFEQRPEDKK